MMAYDPVSRTTLLFGGGGWGISTKFQDTWEWDGSNWHKLSVSGPASRDNGALFWDPNLSAIVLSAGYNGSELYSDSWKLVREIPTSTRKERSFTGSVVLPGQVSTDSKVIGTNITMALTFVLLFYFAATLFNSTIKANYETLRGWLSRASGLFKPLIGSVSRRTSGLKKIRARGYLRILLSVLICALIYCYLDPDFGYNLTGLALFLSFALTIGIVTNCYQGGQSLFGRVLYGIRSRFSIYPIAILIAIAFVVFSRTINFHPGLIYGFVGGYVIFLGPMKADTADERGEVRKAAIVVLCGALLIISVALLAFYLRTFIPQASEGDRSFWVSLADGVLAGVFVGGVQGLFFSLVPLTFLDGAKITAWKWWVWPFVMAPVAFIFWYIINPTGTFSKIVGNMGARMMWGLMGFFLLLSVVTWLYFLLRKKLTPVVIPPSGTPISIEQDTEGKGAIIEEKLTKQPSSPPGETKEPHEPTSTT